MVHLLLCLFLAWTNDRWLGAFPYPQAQDAWFRATGPEDNLQGNNFGDLYLNDLVLVNKKVAHCKLENLEMCKNLRGMLEQGSLHSMEDTKSPCLPIKVSIGFTVSVGVALAEDIGICHLKVISSESFAFRLD
jgi:hypothetical protein